MADVKISRYQYWSYIKSNKWKRKKAKTISRDDGKCRICGTKYRVLHVHHLTYRRFEDEWDSDLVTLCNSCHKEVHDIIDQYELDLSRANREIHGEWEILPHMRHAPGDLVNIVLCSIRGITYNEDAVADAAYFITDNDKISYIHCNSKDDFVSLLKYWETLPNSDEASSKISDLLSGVNSESDDVWIGYEMMYYGGLYDIFISDYRHAKYNSWQGCIEYLDGELKKEEVRVKQKNITKSMISPSVPRLTPIQQYRPKPRTSFRLKTK